MHVPYCIHFYFKISSEGDVWKSEARSRRNTRESVQDGRSDDQQSGDAARYVHMYVSIPPKTSVSKTIGRIKGKSALMIFDRHPEYRERYITGISGQEDSIARQ